MRFSFLMATLLMLAACTTAPTPATPPPDTAVTSPPAGEPTAAPQPNPLFPQSGDDRLTRGEAYIDESELLIRESFPPQIALSISGDLPTPCHQLRADVQAPDAENRIDIDVYSIVDPEMSCVQVLETFEEMVELGSFPSGHYSVWVNGELAGEFDS